MLACKQTEFAFEQLHTSLICLPAVEHALYSAIERSYFSRLATAQIANKTNMDFQLEICFLSVIPSGKSMETRLVLGEIVLLTYVAIILIDRSSYFARQIARRLLHWTSFLTTCHDIKEVLFLAYLEILVA